MKSILIKAAGMALLLVGVGSAVFASPVAPEIDGASASNALALLGGVVLVMRARKR